MRKYNLDAGDSLPDTEQAWDRFKRMRDYFHCDQLCFVGLAIIAARIFNSLRFGENVHESAAQRRHHGVTPRARHNSPIDLAFAASLCYPLQTGTL